MPPAPRPPLAVRISVIAALAVGSVWLAVRYPWLSLAVGALVGVGHFMDRHRRARLRALAAERSGESLCTFARAFPRAQRDPWVLRAVYEEIQSWCLLNRAVPLRPSDRLVDALAIDPDDLDFAAGIMAQRVSRDMRSCRANPYYGQVETVADLVALIGALPRRVAA